MIPNGTDFSQLPAGFQFSALAQVLDRAEIERYLAAVEDDTPSYRGEEALVPPLALAALGMRGVAGLIAAHPGTIHLSQQLRMVRPARPGMAIRVEVGVLNRSERRGFAALTLRLRVLEQREDSDTDVDALEEIMAGEEGLLLDGSLVLLVPLRVGAST